MHIQPAALATAALLAFVQPATAITLPAPTTTVIEEMRRQHCDSLSAFLGLVDHLYDSSSEWRCLLTDRFVSRFGGAVYRWAGGLPEAPDLGLDQVDTKIAWMMFLGDKDGTRSNPNKRRILGRHFVKRVLEHSLKHFDDPILRRECLRVLPPELVAAYRSLRFTQIVMTA